MKCWKKENLENSTKRLQTVQLVQCSMSELDTFFFLCLSLEPSNVNSNKFFDENFAKLNKTIYKRGFMAKLREGTELNRIDWCRKREKKIVFRVLYALCSSLFFTEFMFVFRICTWPEHTVFIKHLFFDVQIPSYSGLHKQFTRCDFRTDSVCTMHIQNRKVSILWWINLPKLVLHSFKFLFEDRSIYHIWVFKWMITLYSTEFHLKC